MISEEQCDFIHHRTQEGSIKIDSQRRNTWSLELRTFRDLEEGRSCSFPNLTEGGGIEFRTLVPVTFSHSIIYITCILMTICP